MRRGMFIIGCQSLSSLPFPFPFGPILQSLSRHSPQFLGDFHSLKMTKRARTICVDLTLPISLIINFFLFFLVSQKSFISFRLRLISAAANTFLICRIMDAWQTIVVDCFLAIYCVQICVALRIGLLPVRGRPGTCRNKQLFRSKRHHFHRMWRELCKCISVSIVVFFFHLLIIVSIRINCHPF